MTILARDIMQRHVVTVTPETTLAELADLLVGKRIGAVPVVQSGAVVGVVSRSDFARTVSLERSLAGLVADAEGRQEFAPGEVPPEVASPAIEGSTSVEVFLEETDAARTYQFSPLPEDLFDSDGQIAKYIFVQRSPTIWDNNDVKPEMLQTCSEMCFPSVNPE